MTSTVSASPNVKHSYPRFLVGLAVVVVIVAVLAEWLLQPATSLDRQHYLSIFAIPVGAAAIMEPILARFLAHRTSVAISVLVVGAGSLALGLAASVLAMSEMVINPDDLRLFIVVLSLASGLSVVLGVQLSRPFVDDVRRMGVVADKVARGDLTVRTGVTRMDELGRTATAIDQMVAALDEAERERDRIAEARQILFRSIGHDLRTPLSAMQAAVESYQDGFDVDPNTVFTLLETELRNVASLVEQLTVYARIEAGSPTEIVETVSITDVAHEAVEAFGPVARRAGVSVELAASGANRVRANHLDLARSIRNLIDNAIEHAGQGGWVQVEVTQSAHGVNGARDVGVQVRVVDSGPGFADEFRDRAFEPFTRGDEARTQRDGHAGLGLAITSGLVEKHHGHVWIDDGPGGDVRLWIPALTADVSAAHDA